MAPEELCVDFKKMDALIDSIREQENNNYLGDSNAHSSYGHERRRSAYLRQVRRVSFLAPPNFQEERGAVSDFANPDHRRASRVTRRSSTFASNPLDRNSFDDNNGKRISRRSKVLSEEEMIAHEVATHHDHAMLRRAEILKIFDEFDIDNSGTLDESELREMFSKFHMNQNLAHVMLLSADTNSDGVISKEEFIVLWDKLHHTQPEQRTGHAAVENIFASQSSRSRRASLSFSSANSKSTDKSSFIHNPHTPNSPKPSKRATLKRETNFLKRLSLHSEHIKAAITVANTLTGEDNEYDDVDDDISETSSECKERMIIEASSRLFQCKTNSTRFPRKKVEMRKPKQIIESPRRLYFKEEALRVRNHQRKLQQDKAVNAIMKLRKVKEHDYVHTMLLQVQEEAEHHQKICNIVAIKEVNKILNVALRYAGLKLVRELYIHKAKQCKLEWAKSVLLSCLKNYRRIKFKQKTFPAIVAEHRRREKAKADAEQSEYKHRIALRRWNEEVEWMKYQLRHPRSVTPPRSPSPQPTEEEFTRPDLAPFSTRITEKIVVHDSSDDWRAISSVSNNERYKLLTTESTVLKALENMNFDSVNRGFLGELHVAKINK